MGDHHDPPARFISGLKCSPDDGLDAEHVKEIGTDADCANPLGLAEPGQATCSVRIDAKLAKDVLRPR